MQDLEDTVSIVRGDRNKSEEEVESIVLREQFIETTRDEMTAILQEVESGKAPERGHATKRATPGTGKSGHVALTQDDAPVELELETTGTRAVTEEQLNPPKEALLGSAMPAEFTQESPPATCGCCPFLSRRARA